MLRRQNPVCPKIRRLGSRAEVSSIRRTKGSGVLVELGPTSKNTFCEAVKGVLGEKASFLGPMCSLEIPDLDPLTEEVEVEEAIKRE